MPRPHFDDLLAISLKNGNTRIDRFSSLWLHWGVYWASKFLTYSKLNPSVFDASLLCKYFFPFIVSLQQAQDLIIYVTCIVSIHFTFHHSTWFKCLFGFDSAVFYLYTQYNAQYNAVHTVCSWACKQYVLKTMANVIKGINKKGLNTCQVTAV